MNAKDKSTWEDDIIRSLDGFDKRIADKHDSDAAVTVHISDDNLKASVKVRPPVECDQDIDAKDVKKALKAAGVVCGIDEDAIREIFLYGSYNVFVPVAHGVAPTNGISARIDYKFNTKKDDIRLEEDNYGNVDHHELNLVQSVAEGAVIAEKIPPRPGKPGTDVMGSETPALQGRDVDIVVGENAELSEDGQSVISKICGQPILRDGKLFVSPVYEVAGDVDFAIGNIDFDGSVLVHGNVLADFKVKAVYDIQVKGNVEKAIVEAGNDILIGGGLYGLNEGTIVAGGSVTIRSVESGNVEAGRNITILQASRHSNLTAGENIILNNPRGSIIGGKIVCGKICDVTELGSTSFTETIVEIGLGPKTMKIRNELSREIEEKREKREKINLNLKTLLKQKKEGTLPAEKEELLRKIIPAFHQLNDEIEEQSGKLRFLMDKINALKGGICKVRNVVHPGVKIITPNASLAVKDEFSFCSFSEHKEEIMFGPYG